jgi:uncharacterized membrane protein
MFAHYRRSCANSDPICEAMPSRAADRPFARGIPEGNPMSDESLIAVFATHETADRAIRELAENRFDMKHLSIVGRGYHTEEKVTGFYNTGDRVALWGKRGAFWGGLWGLLFGGIFLMVPIVGQVMVLGYLATAVASAIEGAIVVGGLSALGAALAGIGVPKDSILQYETALKADAFLVTAHGSSSELARAKTILEGFGPTSLELHRDGAATGAVVSTAG